MSETGNQLAASGADVLRTCGLSCFRSEKHLPLKHVDPSGNYGKGDNLEIDYLIPLGSTCIVGKITGSSQPQDVRKKLKTINRNLNVLRRALNSNTSLWDMLGVSEDNKNVFYKVTDFRAVFITTQLLQFDIDAKSDLDGIILLDQSKWSVVHGYSENIGIYAKDRLLQLLGFSPEESIHSLTLKAKEHPFLVSGLRRIATAVTSNAEVFTFEVSPYDILPISEVFRRDLLESVEAPGAYQRPLIRQKLLEIRKSLEANPTFMFPNSILVVMSSGCDYNKTNNELRIPGRYGALNVIDGQHRLFSYADNKLRATIEGAARIMVTAIRFEDSSSLDIDKYSAQTFVEINTKQTRIESSHLNAIAYAALDDKSANALAAQVILRANLRNSAVKGLFKTNQTTLGIIQTTTVLTTLKSITNIQAYHKLLNRQQNPGRLDGYKSILNVANPSDLTNPDLMIEKAMHCFEWYFNQVKRNFPSDWPERSEINYSALAYAKVIAALVQLLNSFISQGFDRRQVEANLAALSGNIKQLSQPKSGGIILDPQNPRLPSASDSTGKIFQFFKLNCDSPTAIR